MFAGSCSYLLHCALSLSLSLFSAFTWAGRLDWQSVAVSPEPLASSLVSANEPPLSSSQCFLQTSTLSLSLIRTASSEIKPSDWLYERPLYSTRLAGISSCNRLPTVSLIQNQIGILVYELASLRTSLVLDLIEPLQVCVRATTSVTPHDESAHSIQLNPLHRSFTTLAQLNLLARRIIIRQQVADANQSLPKADQVSFNSNRKSLQSVCLRQALNQDFQKWRSHQRANLKWSSLRLTKASQITKLNFHTVCITRRFGVQKSGSTTNQSKNAPDNRQTSNNLEATRRK